MRRKTLRNIIWAAAIALGVAAWMYNPAHLFTAVILFFFGWINCEDKEKEDLV